MKIAIVIYSQTGNTLSVAQKAMSALIEKGHSVDMLKITPKSKIKNDAPISPDLFEPLPDISGYDAYVFASYVEAFSLNRVMKFYLSTLDKVNGSAATLTTQQFMKPWLGGNRTQKQFKTALSSKGAKVIGCAHVHWKVEQGRDARIQNAVDEICSLF